MRTISPKGWRARTILRSIDIACGKRIGFPYQFLLAAAVLTFLFWPGTLHAKLMAVAAGVCPQRPSHTYFLAGLALPLEARMFGIFSGFVVAAAHIVVHGLGLAAPSFRRFAFLLVPVALLAADALNALAYDLGLVVPYQPDNALRLATGLFAGLATALLLMPVVAAHVKPSYHSEPARTRDLLAMVFVAALIWLAIIAGRAWAFYPLAVLGLTGLVLVVALLNFLPLVSLWRSWFSTPALPLLATAVLLAGVELMALSLLRQALLPQLGAP